MLVCASPGTQKTEANSNIYQPEKTVKKLEFSASLIVLAAEE